VYISCRVSLFTPNSVAEIARDVRDKGRVDMRRRIYWLLPDLASARRTMDDLLLARIAEQHLHFVAREGADMTGLHPANILQTSDVIRAAQSGLVIGGAVGALVGGIAAWYFPIVGDDPQWGLVAVLGIVGALIGAWSSSMIGVSTPSNRLARFEPAIEAGQILLMVDVPRSRVDEIEQRLQALHPEAHLEGVEPNIPAFP
jgi:uncharacterized membrane protein YeaQ/YmgE (transglycosylase-associated protein family)